MTIEKTFEELFRFELQLDDETRRAVREGLDEESLALFDLLRKPDLSPDEIRRIKAVAVALLQTVKARIEAIRDWESREATRDSILLTIRDFLWDETSGLPVDQYSEEEVHTRADEIFRHVYRVYPTLPSPYYAVEAVA